jgi:adenylate cyclase
MLVLNLIRFAREKIKSFEVHVWLSPLKLSVMIVFIFMTVLFKHQTRRVSQSGGLDLIGVLERALYDMRFRIRGEKVTSGLVGILAIDEKSIAKFGRWPFPRSVYEPALRNLKRAGVQWIAFDTIYSEPERPYLDESVEGLQKALGLALKSGEFDENKFSEKFNELLEESQGDASFSKGILNFQNIVQGFFYNENDFDLPNYDWVSHYERLKSSSIDFLSFEPGKSLGNYKELIMPGGLTNTHSIAGKSPVMGFFNNQSDTDGIVRQATLVRGILPPGNQILEPILVPSLSLQVSTKYLGRELLVKFDSIGVSQVLLMDPTGATLPIEIPLSAGGEGRMKLNHYGKSGSFPMISLADAYENIFPKHLPKILLAGSVTTGIADLRPSPFGENFNGVEHHAAAVENIITKSFLKRPEWAFFLEMGVLLFSGLGFALVLNKGSALTSIIVTFVFYLLSFFIDKYFLWGKGYWFYLGTIYLQNFVLFFCITLTRYFGEEKEKRKVKHAFQHYLNPMVINQLMEKPEQLKLGGDKKELTVFFSDVRGFTTLSETLTPESLTLLLNQYFTPMTEIILETGGLLDKYIGDAIMAVWGAPLPLEDHPDRALFASLKMLDALDTLREQWRQKGLPLIDIGCGINTGQMVVGNMGSNQRFDYTVLGDSVNLGSRLEGITKEYGVKIICSEYTKIKLKSPQNFMLRELDDIKVKGKNTPVKIFEVLRPVPNRAGDQKEMIELFCEGLRLYRAQEWVKAQQMFISVLKLFPSDAPSQEFLERCEYLRQNIPSSDWDGVWVMKTK